MTEDSFANNASRNTSPLKFFLLVFALSLPFWLAGTLTSFQLLPALPISALAFLCPVTAATIFAYREHRFGGVKKLLGRVFDFTRIKAKIWYGPIILLMPCIMVLSYGVIRLTGVPLPVPPFSVETTLALFVAFFIGALGEELGWSGYAIDPLQARFGALWGSQHFYPPKSPLGLNEMRIQWCGFSALTQRCKSFGFVGENWTIKWAVKRVKDIYPPMEKNSLRSAGRFRFLPLTR
jgi:hypothetical protein